MTGLADFGYLYYGIPLICRTCPTVSHVRATFEGLLSSSDKCGTLVRANILRVSHPLSLSVMAGARHFLDAIDTATYLHGPILHYISSPFSLSFLALAVCYHVLAPRFQTVKQTSWILTTISSAVMTMASLPFVWDYFVGGWSVKNVRMLPTFSVTAVRFFQAHLAADLALGVIYYRSRISLLEGWIHHLLYMLIVEVTIWRSWSHIFCLCALMESPTLILGFSTLFPHLRSNALFAISFFATRIVFHIILGISYSFRENRIHATGGSFLPTIILAMILPMHVLWFVGCIKGFIRRATQARSTHPIPVTALDTRTTTPGIQNIVLTVHNHEPSGISKLSRGAPLRVPISLPSRFLRRRQSVERILRSFRPASKSARKWLVSSGVFNLIPPRDTVFAYVGLGRERKEVPPTPILEKGEKTDIVM